ncbi:uncharacterized protein LOC110247438 [Exaiptasia diaphana]|uniref:CXC MSL2-type domain-containing protein n=1 Tax=Exaiptasia diaphana TaxID=2652724 RepID=A0A913XTJ4_EXADI|nr:uncharacterized protein LOC110247438 [Exaiptasia diaphana]
MNATILYVEACKCMLSISDDSPNSWMELFQLLPKLRQALSCRVCRGLLVDPFGSQSCEHYVCRGCLRKKRSLNPGCRWCLNMDNLVPDQQTKILLACYQKLCEFVTESRAVGHLRSQNGEYSAIVAVIHEAMASPISMDNGSQDQKSDQQEAQANNNNNISSAKSNKMAEQSRGIASKLPAEVIVPLPKRKIIQLLNEMDGSEEQKPQRKKRKHFKGTIYNYNKKKKFKKIADGEKDSENVVCQQFLGTVQTIENVQDSNEEVQVVDEIAEKPLFTATDLSTQIVDNQIRGRLCRCGVSSIGNSKRCVGKRCPCFSKEKSCEHCACCNCANPFNNNNVRLSNELKPILEDEVCVTES